MEVRADFKKVGRSEVETTIGFPPEPENIRAVKRKGREEKIKATCPNENCSVRGQMKRCKQLDVYYICWECGQDMVVFEW
jgi:predicted RNA-binding Zn-ribbon protein involved in translation (DUF1610 family)